MPYQILISTPHAAYGELLRISLEETGDYRVRLVQTAAEALGTLGRLPFDLVILDADLADTPLAEAAARVIALRGPRLMVIPPDNNPKHPMLQGIEIHGYVYRPFYTPDMLEAVGDLMRPSTLPPAPPPTDETAPPAWLEEPSLAEEHLQKALVGCTAHLVLVIRGDQVLVSLGSLDRPAAQEIAGILLRSAPSGLKGDLARYFRLSNIPVDYILYARALTNEARLALIYEVSTPLSRIRSQMNAVIKTLAQAPAPAPAAPAAPEAARENTFEWAVDAGSGEDGLSDNEMANLASWLSEMPSPDPQQLDSSSAGGENPATLPSSPADLGWISPDEPESPAPAPQASLEANPAAVDTLPEDRLATPPVWMVAETPDQPEVTEVPLVGEILDSAPVAEAVPGFVETPEIEQAVDTALQPEETEILEEMLPPAPAGGDQADDPSLEWTRPLSTETAIELVDPHAETRPLALRRTIPLSLLDTASPAFASLSYSACLIPRLPYHYLNGEIAEQLTAWLPELCLAFGWRLTEIHIRPDTCQWVAQLSPAVPPAQMIRAVRQILSQRLFDHFNWLALENPSGDFWAPGYLIISGTQLPSPRLVREFLIQTRRQQGLYNK